MTSPRHATAVKLVKGDAMAGYPGAPTVSYALRNATMQLLGSIEGQAKGKAQLNSIDQALTVGLLTEVLPEGNPLKIVMRRRTRLCHCYHHLSQ